MAGPLASGASYQIPMKLSAPLLILVASVLVLSSCQNRGGWGYGPPPRPYAVYPSHVYADPFGGWDVYKGPRSTRIKHTSHQPVPPAPAPAAAR